MPAASPPRDARALFVVTILAGSFLLFLVQPMIARMALPRLGGTPAVWNSAMLVYQALLLAGYGYAHIIGRYAPARQARIHLALLAVAVLTLPVGLVTLPAPAAGSEPLWVPVLLLLSIGPVFFLVAAQAPLMQRWYAAQDRARAPWALYAASNIGSFAGLLSYPLLAEPLLALHWQSWGWSAGYLALIALVWACARARRGATGRPADVTAPGAPLGWRRVALWIVLSAVPSGLMLSTTTHLTTDIFAMPLLWVIPLGFYLLSFSIAFADRRGAAGWIALATPLLVLLVGGLAMSSRGNQGLSLVFATVLLLFAVCTALHTRLYLARPEPARLTAFYLAMSAGGALGGAFTALVAPLVFDWVWEHPLLVLAAAALLPPLRTLDWRGRGGLEPGMERLTGVILFLFALFCAWQIRLIFMEDGSGWQRLAWTLGAVFAGVGLYRWRAAYVAVLLVLMLAQGGWETLEASRDHLRTRSYFGVYTVRDYPDDHVRTLAHGTTLHGQQSTLPALRDVPTSYYGPTSGIGLVLRQARGLLGYGARIAVTGLGSGTVACFAQPDQQWTFFEIDPAVVRYSRQGTFTYIRDCAPNARIVIGDGRLEMARRAPGSFDLIALDAFSSDSIPLHLLTREAFATYLDKLSPDGLLLVHISNRYIDLEPVVAALARDAGLAAAIRDDNPDTPQMVPSSYVVLARNPARIAALRRGSEPFEWRPLKGMAPRAWSDDHASILPYVTWSHMFKKVR
ncbi:spermidine synthase [Parablastomonas sp. CN1-191]|uniref:spermidine synthase n=1 Tax=Parablastomonas sp. CN1-191 TaxID=3400908 RepID=UPI003BF8A245